MKSLLLAALSLPAVLAAADTPAAIHAVMYEFTYDAKAHVILHAQVVGGFPSVDECKEAMPRVYASGSMGLDEGEQMQLECSGIRERAPDQPEAQPQKKADVSL